MNCEAPNSWDTDQKKCVEPSAIEPVPIAEVPVVPNLIPTSTTVSGVSTASNASISTVVNKVV